MFSGFSYATLWGLTLGFNPVILYLLHKHHWCHNSCLVPSSGQYEYCKITNWKLPGLLYHSLNLSWANKRLNMMSRSSFLKVGRCVRIKIIIAGFIVATASVFIKDHSTPSCQVVSVPFSCFPLFSVFLNLLFFRPISPCRPPPFSLRGLQAPYQVPVDTTTTHSS